MKNMLNNGGAKVSPSGMFFNTFYQGLKPCLDDVSYMFRLSMKQYIHQILQLKSQLVAETNENQKQVKIYISLFIWFPLDFVFT